VSGAATAAFLKAWRQLAPGDSTRRITLAQIDLSVPSALTLRYATTEVHTPDGNTWQTGLSRGPITAQVDWLGSGMAPVDTWIRLAKRRDAAQASGSLGSTNQDLLSRYLWQSGTVTLYRWTPSLASFSDALQIFKGKISRPAEATPDGTTLYLLQDQTWNFQLPPVVDKVNYPFSPDVSQGLPIAIVYGDHSSPPMNAPWASAFGSRSQQEDSGGGRGVVPLVLVDSGVGAASVKLVAAGHSCAEILDRTVGDSAFIAGDSILNPLEPSGITKTIGSSESYLSIADESAIAYAAAVPVDVRASANTALNPRRAMDVNDETSFATLDQTAGQGLLQLIIPNPPAQGYIESVDIEVAWSGNAGNVNNLRVDAFNPGVGAGGTGPATWVSTGTAPAIMRALWSTNYWNQNWQFGSGGAHAWDIRVDFTGGAVNKAHIFWVALIIKYRPQRSVVTPGSLSYVRSTVRTPSRPPNDPRDVRFSPVSVQPTYQLDGQFFGNMKGFKDDGSGTFTGVASALIERPCDIVRHFLATYGLISGGSIETGGGATGSFVDARAVLRSAGPTDFKLACWIGQRSTVQRIVQSMCEQSGMAVYLDRFTNKWLCFVWRPGAVEDYGYQLSWYELAAISVAEQTVIEKRRSIRVLYGYDHFKGRTLYEAFVNPAGSGQGFSLPTIRDQTLVVSAGVNDKLDWHLTGAHAITLTAGTFAPIDLANDVRTKMRAVHGNGSEVGWGFTIKTGYNNLIDFLVSGTPYQGTLIAGDYTPEGLAVEAARALNGAAPAGITFSAAYSLATNLFTISATANFQLDTSGGAAGGATSAGRAMGFGIALSVSAGSLAATQLRYAGRFWIGGLIYTSLDWGTGPNAATNAAYLLGWQRADVALASDYSATYVRGDRERLAATYDGYYDPKEENQITADWIRDEASAVQMRDRTFDLNAKPRVAVSLASYHLPDIRPMQVLQLQADVDAHVSYLKYGTDGSWAGKPLRVLQVNDRPDDLIEILAVEA
jgi:hypothetical protein